MLPNYHFNHFQASNQVNECSPMWFIRTTRLIDIPVDKRFGISMRLVVLLTHININLLGLRLVCHLNDDLVGGLWENE